MKMLLAGTNLKCLTGSAPNFEIEQWVENTFPHNPTVITRGKRKYYNITAAFDIETTSYYDNHGEKRATMYIWQFAIGNDVIIGRTWEQWKVLCDKLQQLKHRIIVYVHNLSYEFQFMRGYFEWEEVFAVKERKPIYARTGQIEFRCSYILSGMSLAKATEKSPYAKRVGSLDYNKHRHSGTHLTDEEIEYCACDVLGLNWYISQKASERDGDIVNLPYTRTGYVREYVKKNTIYKDGFNRNYKKLMDELILTPDEYRQLKRAFQGGFTHAAAARHGTILEDVDSYDFTSSYPYVMCCEYFPMTRGVSVGINSYEDFENYLGKYCCLFDISFDNIELKLYTDTPISASRCWELFDAETDNGRVVAAWKLSTTITELDFAIIRKFYKWESMKVKNMIIYERGYLPPDFIKAILKLYADKTELKDVEEKKIEYALAKEGVNACYGMMVTDIVRDEYVYNDEWGTIPGNTEELIEKYNNSRGRFLSYAWGIWVTAHARFNLFTGIMSCGIDYVYSDTDSVKVLNAEKHKDYFDKYNNQVFDKIRASAAHCGVDFALYTPKTIKGVVKPLGVWDYDGHYDQFLTMGAKRYFVMQGGKLKITVAGVGKDAGAEWLSKQAANPLEFIHDGLEFPTEATGKLTMSYGDECFSGYITDYTGNTAEVFECSYIHAEGASYCMGISEEYEEHTDFVKELMENEVCRYWY